MDDQFQNGFTPTGGNDEDFGNGFLGGASLGSYDGSFDSQPQTPSFGQNDINTDNTAFGGGMDSGSTFGQNDFNSGNPPIGGGIDSGSTFGQNNFSTGNSPIGGGIDSGSTFGQNDFGTGNSPIGGGMDSGSTFGQNDFGTGNSPIGGGIDSGSTFGQNDFGTGNSPIGGGIDSGSTFGQNDFNSGNPPIGGGIGGNTGFGVNNSGVGGSSFDQPQEPYDPNFMFSDPSSGYGAGDPSFSSMNTVPRVSTATMPAQNKNKTLVVTVVILVIGIVVGVCFYVMNNQKKSFREWSNTAEGKTFIAKMQQIADTNYQTDEYNINVFVEGDDKLVMELAMTQYEELTDAQIDFIKSYTEKAMASQKEELGKEIKKVREQEKLHDFSIVYRMTNADGTRLYDIEVKGAS